MSQKLDHVFLKSQLAYFLYAWPAGKAPAPPVNYEAVRDYASATWPPPESRATIPTTKAPSNLLALKTRIGGTKGVSARLSVEPNLLMYEVAKRESAPTPRPTSRPRAGRPRG
ncbi:MAG: hypothetical protein U1G05_00780 [Kiritimatiellia bacterium]